jgi:hypothetical protein
MFKIPSQAGCQPFRSEMHPFGPSNCRSGCKLQDASSERLQNASAHEQRVAGARTRIAFYYVLEFDTGAATP